MKKKISCLSYFAFSHWSEDTGWSSTIWNISSDLNPSFPLQPFFWCFVLFDLISKSQPNKIEVNCTVNYFLSYFKAVRNQFHHISVLPYTNNRQLGLWGQLQVRIILAVRQEKIKMKHCFSFLSFNPYNIKQIEHKKLSAWL